MNEGGREGGKGGRGGGREGAERWIIHVLYIQYIDTAHVGCVQSLEQKKTLFVVTCTTHV